MCTIRRNSLDEMVVNALETYDKGLEHRQEAATEFAKWLSERFKKPELLNSFKVVHWYQSDALRCRFTFEEAMRGIFMRELMGDPYWNCAEILE